MSAKNRNVQSEKRRRRLLSMLADGNFHSGQALAKRLRISRAGVWKLLQTLRALGIEVQSVPRQGYRLPRAVDLLDGKEIIENLSVETRDALERLDVLLTVDSTNRYVDLADTESGRAYVCVTEIQTAGRGRRGRSWVAPFASGICMSLGWRFAEPPPTFSALSLAVGVAAVRAFERCGAQSVGLKWPNDLLWQARKLGGVLIEMRGESEGPASVVIGIGVNMRMPAAVRLQLAEHQAIAVADVHEILRDRTPTRNVLIAILLEELVAMLRVFGERGFTPFVEQWRTLDVLNHTSVKVLTAFETTLGTARGVDDDGALLVDVNGELRRFVSGEVSVRGTKGIGIGDRG
jgi:BirA family biotin operon repressor/biotin-[acetyl-CoA-carboxylase] ligase